MGKYLPKGLQKHDVCLFPTSKGIWNNRVIVYQWSSTIMLNHSTDTVSNIECTNSLYSPIKWEISILLLYSVKSMHDIMSECRITK